MVNKIMYKNHVKYIKINIFTMTIIMHFFT